MATLSSSRDGNRRIQFMDPRHPGKRASIWLGRVPKKAAKTFHSNVEALLAALRLGTSPAAELCAWLRDLPDVTYEKLVGVGIAEPRVKDRVVTLDELLDTFVARASVKASTRAAYNQTTGSLRKHLGGNTPLTSIGGAQADIWKKAIIDEGLSPATVAKRVYVARAIFRKAVKWDMVPASTFEDLPAGSQQNPDRSFYVSAEVTGSVLEQCPGAFWRLVLGLGRYAGLRTPSEVALLTWEDIAWDTGRLTVRSPKTARHDGHAVRLVPICPELRVILAEAYDQASEGTNLILPRSLTGASNLRTTFRKIITRAGHRPWPRLFQNLRASCATDWVERYPAHVVAKWLGHSPMIAASHYLQTRERHFADVVTGGERAAAQNPPSATPESVHLCVQSEAAATSSDPHESHELGRKLLILRNDANRCEPRETTIMGDIGLEPMTPSLSSWCSNQLS
jgi:integrase